MVPKVDPPKFPEMLNAITENVRDSYAGMVFIDDPEDLDSWGFTKEQLDELDSFAQKYGLTDVLEINEWNPDSKPDYILSAFSGLVDKIDDLQGRIRPKANDVSIEKVENGHPNRIDIPEKPEDIEMEQNAGVSKEKPPVAEMEDSSIQKPKSHPTQPEKPVWTNLEVPPDSVVLLTGVSRKTDRPWYRADCTLGEESSIKPGGKFKILLGERQYARADAQQKAGKPVSLGLKTARYPDGVEIDGEMVTLEDLAADINVRKTDPLPKSPEEYRGATEQSFNGNEWVNFHFFPNLVDLSKFIDPDTARTDYRADVTSEIAGRNCSFTLHLAKWQYDKAVKAQNQNSPIHIGMKLKYIKGGVIPVQFEGEQFTHNYSPKKLEESLPKVQKARSVSGCRQGKGNRVSSYQDRSYRFKTKEVYERGLPGTHESRN